MSIVYAQSVIDIGSGSVDKGVRKFNCFNWKSLKYFRVFKFISMSESLEFIEIYSFFCELVGSFFSHSVKYHTAMFFFMFYYCIRVVSNKT